MASILFHIQICWKLFLKLVSALSKGTSTWLIMMTRLILFVMVLMPGWIALLRYYIFDPFIIRNIEYGKGSQYRNLLDIYLPPTQNPSKEKKAKKYVDGAPVIVFVSGGAWIIGYKLWSALIGRELSRLGYLVIVPDYRNFPQGNITDMIVDIKAAIKWAKHNAASLGGNENKIILAGQSAGAHISLCTLLNILLKECSGSCAQQVEEALHIITNAQECSSDSVSDESDNSTWKSIASPAVEIYNDILSECTEDVLTKPESLSHGAKEEDEDISIHDIKLYVGINGPYNLLSLEKHFHSRGLDTEILHVICDQDIAKYSPTIELAKLAGISLDLHDFEKLSLNEGNSHISKESSQSHVLSKFPHVSLHHGVLDKSIPTAVCVELHNTLAAAGCGVSLNLYQHWAHTDGILEDLLVGNSLLIDDISTAIENCPKLSTIKNEQSFNVKGSQGEALPVMVSPTLVSLAKYFNPF